MPMPALAPAESVDLVEVCELGGSVVVPGAEAVGDVDCDEILETGAPCGGDEANVAFQSHHLGSAMLMPFAMLAFWTAPVAGST
jgi:hypothetical protein